MTGGLGRPARLGGGAGVSIGDDRRRVLHAGDPCASGS
jgi:hypothetical protein